MGLEYIHENKFLHRDIKPENLVLDEKGSIWLTSLGYLRITDFGVAKQYQKDNSSETSGTPGYMAPEVMCAQNHSYGVDYFALGVITYEFMLGLRPYLGRSRKEIKEMILAKQVQVKHSEIPQGWSNEAALFINSVLDNQLTLAITKKAI
jgi:serine/threonine protein kinase